MNESLRFRTDLTNLNTIQQICDLCFTIDHYKISKILSFDADLVVNLFFLSLLSHSIKTEFSFRKGSANPLDERYLVTMGTLIVGGVLHYCLPIILFECPYYVSSKKNSFCKNKYLYVAFVICLMK